MKTITLESANELKKEFEAYTKTAEQNEFPLLLIIERKMAQTFEVIEKDASYIGENQSELRAMFRVVLSVMGKDTSEYEEAPVETGEEVLRKYRNWANRKIRAIKDEKLREEVRKCFLDSVETIKKQDEESIKYSVRLCKKFWDDMVEKVKKERLK
jgi:hypothetical protein